MARVTVVLPDPAGEALWQLAAEEWRRPADQAAYLITEALRQRGVLPAESARVLVGGDDDPPASPLGAAQ